jgi:aldehyde dehydrogenase (NAD+)
MMKSAGEIIAGQNEFFDSHTTLDIDFRLTHLKRLKQNIKQYEGEIVNALHADLGKSEFESFSTEIGLVQHELTLHIRKLKRWAKPKRAGTPIYTFSSHSYVCQQPYGLVLIISPFNYPFMLAFAPLIGAVSAGNVVSLKPSEFTPSTSAVIEKIIKKTFDKNYVAVFQGGIKISQELLSIRWDKIFFTGSSRVGKIVLEAAAKYLTPVVLELGGKNPVVVDSDANLEIAARRIIWGKLLNAGQSCVAPDYLFVHSEVKDKFLKLMVDAIESFFSSHPQQNGDFSKMVSQAAVERLSKMMENTTVYFGGKFDRDSKYFSPTILTDVTADSPVMKEEVFGPVLPVLTFEKQDEVIEFIKKGEKPLATFYFSEDQKKQKEFLQKTYSGDAMINDVVLHFTNLSLPFGGVGYSGMGSYHGKRSFDVFSHERSVMNTSTRFDLPFRYPPYKKWVLNVLKILFR